MNKYSKYFYGAQGNFQESENLIEGYYLPNDSQCKINGNPDWNSYCASAKIINKGTDDEDCVTDASPFRSQCSKACCGNNISTDIIRSPSAGEDINVFWSAFIWDDLNKPEKVQFKILGWDKSKWDDNTGFPDSMTKSWNQLSNSQRNAATLLSFTEDLWRDPNDNDNDDYIKTPNAYMPGNNKVLLNQMTVDECKTICSKNNWCKSFDYKTNKCYLSKANITMDGKILKTSSLFQYYEKK